MTLSCPTTTSHLPPKCLWRSVMSSRLSGFFNGWTCEADFNISMQHLMCCVSAGSFLTLITTCQVRVLVFPPGWYTEQMSSVLAAISAPSNVFSPPAERAHFVCKNHRESRQTAIGWWTFSGFNNVSFSFLGRLLGFHSWYAAGCRLIRTAWAVSPSTLIGEDEACFQLCGCLLDNFWLFFFGSSCCGVQVTSLFQPPCC